MSQPLVHMPFNQKPIAEGVVLGLYPEVQKRPLPQAPGLNQTSGQAPDEHPLNGLWYAEFGLFRPKCIPLDSSQSGPEFSLLNATIRTHKLEDVLQSRIFIRTLGGRNKKSL
jgi:hypothetical protein